MMQKKVFVVMSSIIVGLVFALLLVIYSPTVNAQGSTNPPPLVSTEWTRIKLGGGNLDYLELKHGWIVFTVGGVTFVPKR